MARNQSNGPNGALKFAGAADAAIVGGITIGYLFGGTRAARPVEQAAPPPPVVSTPAPSVAPVTAHPRITNGNYTAPGAPSIQIHEESAPHMRRVDQAVPTLKPKDAEASQEAAPPVKPNLPAKPVQPQNPGSDSTDTLTQPPTDNNDTAPPPPDNAAPANPAPSPADPDFEHVNKPGDTQSGQAAPPKAQFRVQTGAYTDESNARSIADQLRGQGYATTTRSEHEGDHLIYKVQVGAYSSRAGAGKAAGDLQKKGFPAYVSPVGP